MTKIDSSLQTYNEFWKHGSICEDYHKIEIPVLLIGGWHDLYTNAVFRMVRENPHFRGIIGPWSHEWPDIAVPGPQIGFLDECLDFWKYHLVKGTEVCNDLICRMLGASVKFW